MPAAAIPHRHDRAPGRAGRSALGVGRVALLSTLIALVGGGCGTPASSSGTAASGAATTQPRDDRALTAFGKIVATPVSAATVAELDDTALDRAGERSGVAASLGATRWTAMTQLLRDASARAGTKAGLARRDAPMAALGALPPPPTALGAGGVSLALAWGMASAVMSEGSPLTNGDIAADGTREVVENGERTVGTVAGGIQFSSSGSQVSAAVDISIQVQQFDAATGAARGSSTLRMVGTIKLDFCPDAQGKVRGSSSLATTASGAAGSYAGDSTGEITVTVGDDAFAQSVEMAATASDSLTPPGGSAAATAVSGGGTIGLGPRGSLDGHTIRNEHGRVDRDTANASDAAVDSLMRRAGQTAGLVMGLIVDKAQAKWRGGACLEILSSEPGRDVRKNESVPFTARLRHKIEGVELQKPIHTSFAGLRSVDPVDIEVPAPVDLVFKAGSQENDQGTVHLKSTSNRGIAELDVAFRVKGGWKIATNRNNNRLIGQKCGDPPGEWILDGTYDQVGMHGVQKWVITIGPDGRTGTYTYTDDSSGNPGGAPVRVIQEGRAAGTVTLTLDDAGRAVMQLQETSHSFRAYTNLGGSGSEAQDVPLIATQLVWETGAAC